MSEYGSILEETRERFPTPELPLEGIYRLRDRRRRNQRLAAGAVGVAIAIAIAVAGSAVLRSERKPQPADKTRIIHEGEVVEPGADGTLVATDTATGDQRTLARCPDCFFPFRKFSASVDGRWIAYSSIPCHLSCTGDEPAGGIWVVGATGPPVLVGGSWTWAWSPTTQQLAFVGESKDGTELALFDPATGERTSIVTTHGGIPALAWAPDGSTIAYVANQDEPSEPAGIFIVRPDGTPQRIGGPSASFSCCSLDAMNGFDDLAWSPDGTRLALSTQRDGLTVVAVDGSGEPRIIDPHHGSFAWSPDGRQIAFGDGQGIVVVPASGGTPMRYGSSTVQDIDRLVSERWMQGRANWFLGFGGGIVWSPDGKLIAFTQGLDWKAVSVG